MSRLKNHSIRSFLLFLAVAASIWLDLCVIDAACFRSTSLCIEQLGTSTHQPVWMAHQVLAQHHVAHLEQRANSMLSACRQEAAKDAARRKVLVASQCFSDESDYRVKPLGTSEDQVPVIRIVLWLSDSGTVGSG